jgi:hypothetical protein
MQTPIIKLMKELSCFVIPRAIPSNIEWKPRAINRISGEMLTPHTRTYFSKGFP